MIRLLVKRKNGKFSYSEMERLANYHSGDTIWADVTDPTDEDMEKLVMNFQLHPLAVEDCLTKVNNIKLDVYDDHLFIVFTSPVIKGNMSQIMIRYLFIFFSKEFVITLHSHPIPVLDSLIDHIIKNNALLERGTDYILHKILDVIVDRYTEVSRSLEKRISILEDLVTLNPDHSYLNRVFKLKKFINRSRQHTYYKINVIDLLLRNRGSTIKEEMTMQFRDIRDHLVSMSDMLDRERDSLNTLLTIFLNASSHKLNEVMKVLAVISIVFMPLNVLAGVGGMSEFSMMTKNIPWPISYSLFTVGLCIVGGITYLMIRNLGSESLQSKKKKIFPFLKDK
ncbi:MAG: magnesium transporter CorA family protein [Spirochaetes bacterium]|nr:magnesium transporter CorA family protein [Spirochaetota bacterium]